MRFISNKTLKLTIAVLLALTIVSVLYAYLHYLELKEELVLKISGRISSIIGQETEIGDISVSLPITITLHDIRIKNPSGFPSGNLLRIKKISMGIRASELFKGKLHLKNIDVIFPELNLIRDKNGKTNVSDALMLFFLKKSAIRYQVDEITIDSGSSDLNNDRRLRFTDINLKLTNISSEPGTMTSIKGLINYSEDRIKLEGWMYLKDEPKKINLSISSKNLALSVFKDFFEKYRIDAEKIKAEASINIDGNTYDGINLKSKIKITGKEFLIFGTAIKNIAIDSDMFLNLHDYSVAINEISLYTDGSQFAMLKGAITDLRKFSYNVDIRINRLDVSSFNFIKGTEISGIATSDNINLKGQGAAIPGVSGIIRIRNAALITGGFNIKGLNADLEFLHGEGISANIKASAKMLKTGAQASAFDMRVSLNSQHRKNMIAIRNLNIDSGTMRLSSKEINIRTPESNASYLIDAENINAAYPSKEMEVKNLNLRLNLSAIKKAVSGDIAFSLSRIIFQGIEADSVSGNSIFDEKSFHLDIPQAQVSNGRISLSASGKSIKSPFPADVSLIAQDINLSAISKKLSGLLNVPYNLSGEIKQARLEGIADSFSLFTGKSLIIAKNIGVLNTKTKRHFLKGANMGIEIRFNKEDIELTADTGTGNISATISGTIKNFIEKTRAAKIRVKLPMVKLTDIRDSFWDVFPDRLLYARLEGHVSPDVLIDYSDAGLTINGEVHLRDLILAGENNEYMAGPVNGRIPIAYSKSKNSNAAAKMPSFEKSEFNNLNKYYSQEITEGEYSRITIGSFSYGFRMLEDINLWIRQEGSVLNIARFSGNIFGGKLTGSAVVDMSDRLNYRAGMVLKGLSLTRLCKDIEPIKGYISGRVDGIATIKGTGTDVSSLIGRADFWTYSQNSEKTKISKEFLQKIGGASLKTYLGDRKFDKGVMSIYLQNGYIIFKELEISNKNFIGMTDLSIKVAPFNNRIAVDHLMWSITEAAHRAKKE